MKVAEVMQNNVKPTYIQVDVYSSWHKEPPAYRIYIDNELMTERTFLDQSYEFYREGIFVNLEPGTHSFIFEKLPTKSLEDKLSIKNFKVNEIPYTLIENQFTVTE